MVFQYKILIQERHLDTFGHVNNATYLSLYEEARWDLIQHGGWGLERIKAEAKGPVILDLHLTFKRELTNRTPIVIHTRFKEMKGDKLMILEQWMTMPDDKIASTLELTVGMMDMKVRKLVVPSADWLAAVGAM
jgi:YbgC/YbaW family acyl-CoA thioester hydrolase